jgi:hypothetical protein
MFQWKIGGMGLTRLPCNFSKQLGICLVADPHPCPVIADDPTSGLEKVEQIMEKIESVHIGESNLCGCTF